MINEILNKIKEYKKIIIHRHIRPDGDCIGSQHGLKKAIQLNFPEKEVYAVGDVIPEYLKEYGALDIVTPDMYKGALVIVVDTASSARVCNENYKLGDFLIKIDHHDDSEDYANINYVCEKVPACAAIIASLLKEWNFTINKEIATYLFVGIVTDTGRFRFRGVDEHVMNMAGYLLSYDIDTEKLYTSLYMKEASTYKLQGYVYQNYKLTENGVAYIHFTKKLMKKFGVTKDDAANLVNSLDSIKGSLIWICFVDQETKEIRVRLRSRFVAINDVARRYRGGGHLQAAGSTIYNKKEKLELLQDLDNLLKDFKEKNPDVY